MGGVSVTDEDVLAFDGTDFSLYFDGSDVGVTGDIDALGVISDTEMLLSLTGSASIPGISGTVDDSDVIKFTGTFGPATSGSFEMFFDGSDIGLTSSGEDIDGVEVMLAPDGTTTHVLFSAIGAFSADGLSGGDEDIVACSSPTTGPVTSCGFLTLHYDGSDIGLGGSGEDVDGVSVADGRIYLSTAGSFGVNGLSGADEDVFVCDVPTTGPSSACGSWSLFFDGSAYGLASNDLNALDLR